MSTEAKTQTSGSFVSKVKVATVEPRPPLVIYHANCPDGYTAAWIAHRAMSNDGLNDAPELLPMQYGTPLPASEVIHHRDVFLLDFSFKRPAMIDLIALANSVTVIDHHKTAEEELKDLLSDPKLKVLVWNAKTEIILDMTKCGAMLTWEFFNEGQEPPMLVHYVQDRDLWKNELQDTEEISAVIASFEHDLKRWDRLRECMATYLKRCDMVLEGRAILRAKRKQIKDACRGAAETLLGGHLVLATNTNVNFSEVAGELADGRPFGAAYFIRRDGKVQWSLRSREGGVDVSQVAKQYGGGGHFGAAGFESDLGFLSRRLAGYDPE